MSSQNQAVTLTAEQLKDLMLTMAKELRKPADPTPEELAQAENDRKSRPQAGSTGDAFRRITSESSIG